MTMLARVGLVLVLVSVPILTACTQASVQCECVPGGLQIATTPGQVASVTASGPACESPTIRCGGPDSTYRAGCEYYYLTPSATGDCAVEVALTTGDSKSKTVTFSYSSGECCAGYHVVDGDWSWDVTQ